jgi:hypothetical protein
VAGKVKRKNGLPFALVVRRSLLDHHGPNKAAPLRNGTSALRRKPTSGRNVKFVAMGQMQTWGAGRAEKGDLTAALPFSLIAFSSRRDGLRLALSTPTEQT